MPSSEMIRLDSIAFGIRESELGHRALGAFVHEQRQGPAQTLFKGPNHLYELTDYGADHWRDAASIFGFEFSIPAGTKLAHLTLEFSLRRYNPGTRSEQIKPTAIYVATETKIYNLSTIELPLDRKWHTFHIDLDRSLPDTFAARFLSVFIDDNDNYLNPENHYGISISQAAIFCLDSPTVQPSYAMCEDWLNPSLDAEVLLVVCPVWDIDLPPISVAGVGNYLRAKGISVQIFDFNIESFISAAPEEVSLWSGYTATRWIDDTFRKETVMGHYSRLYKAAERIAASPAKFVAFSIYSTNIAFTTEIAKILRKIAPSKLLVYGGPGIIFVPWLLGCDWDFLVVGDGEQPLYHIATGQIEGNPGIVPRTDPEKITAQSLFKVRNAEPDLDLLPLQNFDLFYLNNYHDIWTLPAYTSRGCVRRCAYCFDSHYYSPYRHLSGERAFEHLTNLYERHGRTYFELSDLLLNGNIPAVSTMCRLLSREKTDFEWGGFAIIRPDMTAEHYALLKSAGCDYLRYGFETGCARHLKSMHRGYSIKTASEAFRKTFEAGIKVRINILIGFPEETDETVEETLEFIRQNATYISKVDTVNTVSLMPQTELVVQSDKHAIEYEQSGSWKTPSHDLAKRQSWAVKVLKTLRETGILSPGGMIEGKHQEIQIENE